MLTHQILGRTKNSFASATIAVLIVSIQFAQSSLAAQDELSNLVAEISAVISEVGRIEASVSDDPKDQLATSKNLLRKEQEIGDKLNLGIKRLTSRPDDALSTHLPPLIEGQFGRLEKDILQVQQRMDEIRDLRADAPADGLLDFEYNLRGYDDLLSKMLQELLDNTERAEAVKLESTAAIKLLDDTLKSRAERQADRLGITQDRIKIIEERLARAPDGERVAIEKELLAIEERQKRIISGLDSTIDMLRARDLDATRYAQLLIKSTGEISGDLLDSKILVGLAEDWLQVTRDAIAKNGPGWLFKAFVFLIILLAAKLFSKLAGGLVGRAVRTSKMNFSTLLQQFFIKLAANIVLVLGFLIALAQIGIHLGPVLAGLGVAGLIVGFALQDTLSNFASGMMILVYRPYDVGDVIEAAGVSGKVQRMNLVSTTVLTFDNQKLIVPNNKIWGGVIRNVNAAPTRRVDLTFGIAYDDDISVAESLLHEILSSHELVLKDPEPNIRLHKLGESSVDFIVRPWVNAPDYWSVYWDVTRAVKQKFTEAGITIPFPQRDLHVYRHGNDGDAEIEQGSAVPNRRA